MAPAEYGPKFPSPKLVHGSTVHAAPPVTSIGTSDSPAPAGPGPIGPARLIMAWPRPHSRGRRHDPIIIRSSCHSVGPGEARAGQC
eukprot:14221-Hanusia_phi.AAC.1